MLSSEKHQKVAELMKKAELSGTKTLTSILIPEHKKLQRPKPIAIMGDLYSSMFNCVGFNWACSPSYSELESIVLDWLCKALKLRNNFLSHGKGYLQHLKHY